MDDPRASGVTYERDCVLYLRKSKGKAGIARQRRDCLALAERLRWRVIGEKIDTDATAFVKIGGHVQEVEGPRTRRKDYQDLLHMLRTDQRQQPLGVLSWHADRILRDVLEAEEFIGVCAPGRHPVETARSGGYELWTPTGRKRLRNDVVDSTYEVDHLTERLESDRDEKAREGRWHGGPVPFGWKYVRLDVDEDARELVLHPEQAEAIRWAHVQVLRGASLYAIAAEWNRRGLRRPKGGLWDGGQVRRVLLRSRNAALMTRHGEVMETELPGGKGDWPPIVTEEVWKAVVETLTAPGRGPTNSRVRKWLGSNLYLCGAEGCDQTLRTAMGSGGRAEERRPVVIYRCRSGEKGHVARNAERLDAYVSAVMVARLSRPDLKELLGAEELSDVEEIRTRLAVQESELRMWRRLAREGEVSALAFAESEKAVLGRIAAIKGELREAVRTPLLVELLDVEDIAAEWESQSLAWRRMVLNMMATVVVRPARRGRPPAWRPGQSYFTPDGVEFVWRQPRG